jgi:hypothetical protein
MVFELISDMGSTMGTAQTAVEMRSLLQHFKGKLAKNGLFIAHNGRRISVVDFERLCDEESRD